MIFKFYQPPIFVMSCLMAISAMSTALASEVTLEDSALRVGFDANSGALVRLENSSAHWTIERRPELGVSGHAGTT